MAGLETIEGIGPANAEKLKAAGIKSIEKLMSSGATPSGRKELEDLSGIGHKTILNFVNRADLCRIKGVSGQYGDLLELAGVDTVPELGQRNAANLHAKMEEVNKEKNLVRKLPALSQVEDWVAQAKELPRVIKY